MDGGGQGGQLFISLNPTLITLEARSRTPKLAARSRNYTVIFCPRTHSPTFAFSRGGAARDFFDILG